MRNKEKSKDYKALFYIEVDAELVVRNIIFFVLFCIAIATSINHFLWPVVESYKAQYVEEKKIKIVFLEVQKNFNATQASLANTKKTNAKYLNVMSYNPQPDQLKQYFSKYFGNIETIKKVTQENTQDQFRINTYFIRGQIHDLAMMDKFFSELQSAPMSVKILLPVIVKRLKNSDRLTLEFYLNVEKSNYKPETTN